MIKKVLVALSGGVDSAAAAVQVLRSGMDAAGVYMKMHNNAERTHPERSCSSPRDAEDAKKIAEKLGIEFILHDALDEFSAIRDGFIRSYEAGRTPNPCIRCNQLIKFSTLFNLADRVGADYVSTGHYARVVRQGDSAMIARAGNIKKDQSYVLFNINPEFVGRIMFPNGEISEKSEVRDIVRQAGLDIHEKAESQDICFVPDGDYRQLLEDADSSALTPGSIIDCEGNVLGTHEGYGMYTIGQRRGLKIAAGKPIYVCDIDPETAAVTVGPKETLISSGVRADGANWFKEMPDEFDCDAQIRYGSTRIKASVRLGGDDTFEVVFREPAYAATPGQGVVLYDNDIMLGGGWIDRVIGEKPNG